MLLVYGLGRVRSGVSEKKPFVSVVIAARNEKARIKTCLTSLMRQNYKSDLFEVVVADDRSVDGTSEILEEFKSFFENLKIIRIDRVPEGISPKKNAVAAAIGIASGDIILQTDADCAVPENWITGMAARFEDGIVMVCGAAPYLPGSGALSSFVCHEYLWNITMSAGSIALGHGTHASARNLGFRRRAFERSGGYGDGEKVISGDDTLLLHRIQAQDPSGVATVPDSSTHVYTRAPEDFKTFLRQRTRHMSTGKYFDPALIAVGGVIYGYHVLSVLSIFLAAVSPVFLAVFLVSLLWKNAVDLIAFVRTRAVFGIKIEWRKFILNELFLMIYLAVMPIAGLFFSGKWKEN
jgi:cellulose synthase/poly-beta-1,6-N-acetylglucosamine synthase-like glycosyltransferase